MNVVAALMHKDGIGLYGLDVGGYHALVDE